MRFQLQSPSSNYAANSFTMLSVPFYRSCYPKSHAENLLLIPEYSFSRHVRFPYILTASRRQQRSRGGFFGGDCNHTLTFMLNFDPLLASLRTREWLRPQQPILQGGRPNLLLCRHQDQYCVAVFDPCCFPQSSSHFKSQQVVRFPVSNMKAYTSDIFTIILISSTSLIPSLRRSGVVEEFPACVTSCKYSATISSSFDQYWDTFVLCCSGQSWWVGAVDFMYTSWSVAQRSISATEDWVLVWSKAVV